MALGIVFQDAVMKAHLNNREKKVSNAVHEMVDSQAPREREYVWEWSSDRPLALWATWREMVTEVYQYRELLGQMVLRDLRIRYKQAVMGFAWAILMPLLIVAAGCLVKIALAHASGNGVELPRVAGMSIKALGWAFFAGALGFSSNSLIANIALVTKVYFPRELFPLSAVLTQLVDTCIGGVFMAILLVIFAQIGVTTSLLWVPVLMALLVVHTTAVALIFSCANVFFRDVKYLVQILLMFGIFFTPVFYEPELFGRQGAILMMLNPLSPILEGLRLAVIEKETLLTPILAQTQTGVQILVWHPGFLVYSAGMGIAGLALAWWIFHRSEFLFAEFV